MELLLNVHRASAPSLSPDGRTLAFLSDATGLQQPYALDLGHGPVAEGQWRRLLTSPERIQWINHSPDGRFTLMGRDHGGDENTQFLRAAPDGTALTELTSTPAVRHMFGAFNSNGSSFAYSANSRDPAAFDVFIRTVADGAARSIFAPPGHHEAHDFSPDNRFVAVLEEHGGLNEDLYLVNAATGTSTHLTPHQGAEQWLHPQFSRDGRSLFALTDKDHDFNALALLSLRPQAAPNAAAPNAAPSAAPVQFVLSEEHDIDNFELTRSRDLMAVIFNLDGASQLRFYDVRDPAHPRERPRPTLPSGVITTMEFSHDGRYLAFGLSRSTGPDEVYRIEVAHNTLERLTDSAHEGIALDALVEPTVEHVRSSDGETLAVYLYIPRDLPAGVRAPVVVNVHGGPEAQFQPYFNPVIQYLVGHGYIVAAPNVRGSTGYGKRFSHLDDITHREDSVRDLAEVNRWLRARPDVAPDRIAVMGGSYGGYMTLAAITLYPDLWAAACDIVGIANFRTFLERTASYRRALREAEYGSLSHDAEFLDRVSPIHRVDAIRTPLFVIHGANDPRVPVTEAEQMVEALRARHHRVEYIRFDNEGHGVSRRENKIRAYGELTRFFDDIMTR